MHEVSHTILFSGAEHGEGWHLQVCIPAGQSLAEPSICGQVLCDPVPLLPASSSLWGPVLVQPSSLDVQADILQRIWGLELNFFPSLL